MKRVRLTDKQIELLDLLKDYDDYAYVDGLNVLRALQRRRLAEPKYPTGSLKLWRITHDGLAVLKQNGYFPVDPATRSSVRGPRQARTP
jgi:hypothetical protein